MDWSVVDSENADDNAAVTLELKDGPYSRAMWDFGFRALYKVGSLINGNSCMLNVIFFKLVFLSL